jgi:hypothetical protein
MKRLVRGAAIVAAAGAIGIGIAIGGVGHATVGADTGTATTAACPAPPQGNQGAFGPSARANGTVASISGTTFTLTGQNNTTYTVTTDANTRFDKLVTASVGAIAVGDMVMAQGTTSASTFAATTITDNGARMQQGNPGGNGQPPAQANGTPPARPANCAPPQGQPEQPGQPGQQGPQGPQGQQPPGPNGPNGANDGTFAGGIVQQVNGTTLTLSTRDGTTLTVTTDSATKVTARQQGALTDLHVGDQVMAMAAPQSGTAGTAAAFTAAVVSDRTAH